MLPDDFMARFRTNAGLTEVNAVQRRVLELQQDAAQALKESSKDWGTVSYSYRDDYFNRTVKETKTLSAFMPSAVANVRGGFNVLIVLKESEHFLNAPAPHPHVRRQNPAHRELGISLSQLAEELGTYDFTVDDTRDTQQARAEAFNAVARRNLDAAIKAVLRGLPDFKMSLVSKGEQGNYWAKVFWAKLEATPF